MDCSLPGSSVHGISQAIVLEWIAISFSKGIFPTQGSNPGLPHCRQTLYRLSHQGSPNKLIWGCSQQYLPPQSSAMPRCTHASDTCGNEARSGSQQLRAVTPASFCCVVRAVYRDKAPPWRDNRQSQWGGSAVKSSGGDSCYQYHLLEKKSHWMADI